MRINRQNLMEKPRRFFAQSPGLCGFRPAGSYFLIGYMTRVFPVGKRNVLTIDLYHQYAPFIEAAQRLTSGGSVFTWAGAGYWYGR